MALSSCGPRGNNPNVEIIQDMMESPAIKAQEYDENSPHHSGMRVPPDHAQLLLVLNRTDMARTLEGASKMKNPLAGKMDEETLLVGQKYYETNCAVCHGMRGEGGVEGPNPRSLKKMALKPPSVCLTKSKRWSDGHLYHVITMGQGVMGPYASHIPQKYRWQVVNCIRC